MLKTLRLPAPNNETPATAPKCLACHAVDANPAHQGQSFDISDGVSCEACHGAAEKWFEKHTTRDWNYAKSVQLGMCDTRNLIVRANKCLSCHLGDSEKSIDHAMLAAGHPDLFFELDSFEAVMPRHWKYPPEADPWIGVRSLAVGQAVQLSASLQRLCRRAGQPNWPEFTELDCFSCHHSLTSASDSWRQKRGYPGRKDDSTGPRPGDPPYNRSRYVLFRKIVDEFDPGASNRLDAQMERVYTEMSVLKPVRAQVIQDAATASETANSLSRKLLAAQFDDNSALRLMKSISSDPDVTRDERSAEQATMALESLYVGLSGNNRLNNNAELGNKIKALFQDFQNPSSYNPYVFATKMQAIHALL